VRIFLSHSHLDRSIAAALKTLLDDLFGDRVAVSYSSDESPEGGIAPGEPWLAWIQRVLATTDTTYVLLTPNSIRRAWVLWEAGAAAGVALGAARPPEVVPVTFGIDGDDVPQPLQSAQVIRGDTDASGGIVRLLDVLNQQLDSPLTARALQATERECLPGYLGKIADALEGAAPLEMLLASVPAGFPASKLAGHWATSYQFTSNGATRHHADVAELTAESDRRLRATNRFPSPRTEGYARPFLNEIEAELANRHVIGHWKNLNDTRYFGAIHLAVLTGECVMAGYYSSFSSDVSVGCGEWRWVRIDPDTVRGADLPSVTLRPPQEIHALLTSHASHAGPITLAQLKEGD